MAAGALAADFISDLLANCLSPQRRRQHPCASGRLRALAAAEAWLIKAFSEGGRALGHLKRGQWRGFYRAFDWFCGIDPGGRRPSPAPGRSPGAWPTCTGMERVA